MKYTTKKIIIPICLLTIAITTTAFIIIAKTNKKEVYQSQFVMIKFQGKNIYPFYLTFKKGTTLREIVHKLKINPYYRFYNKRKQVDLDQPIYESTIFQIKK